MILSDMIASVQAHVDDIISQSDAILWFNEAKDIMATRIEAKFPDIDGTTVTEFAFPAKYHRIPVIYASSKYQEANLMRAQALDFFKQFEEQLAYFVDEYNVPPQYRDSDHVQQFTATAGQLAYVITNNTYDPGSGKLKVYLNNRESFDWQYPKSAAASVVAPSQIVTTSTTTNSPFGFIFNTTTTVNANDLVTAEWEQHPMQVDPPYPWWSGALGW